MSVTIVEHRKPSIGGKITIRPYIDNTIDNMGLQNYGQILFDGITHEEQLACIEAHGVKRYVTGLNEFSPSVKKIPNEQDRKAKIKQIRETVSQLEKELASNVVDPEDKDFWGKVKLLQPDNDEFWSKISIRCSNEPLYLNPDNPHDLIKLIAIEEGGFSIVARNYEDAKRRSGSIKFYLDKYEETVSSKTEVKKIKNKAVSCLQDLFDTNIKKLFYIAKVADVNSAFYKHSTPNDIIYDNMDNYISGLSYERSALKASKDFLELSRQNMEDLKLRAVVKDMIYYKIAFAKSDGFIYHRTTNTVLGRNSSDVVEFLKNPMNDDLTTSILEKVEEVWNK